MLCWTQLFGLWCFCNSVGTNTKQRNSAVFLSTDGTPSTSDNWNLDDLHGVLNMVFTEFRRYRYFKKSNGIPQLFWVPTEFRKHHNLDPLHCLQIIQVPYIWCTWWLQKLFWVFYFVFIKFKMKCLVLVIFCTCWRQQLKYRCGCKKKDLLIVGKGDGREEAGWKQQGQGEPALQDQNARQWAHPAPGIDQ